MALVCPLLLAYHKCSNQCYKRTLQDQGAPLQETVTYAKEDFTSLQPSSPGLMSSDARQQSIYDVCELVSASATQNNWEFSRDNVNIVKEIGKGAFSQVVKAEAWNINGVKGVTIVAVKMLKSE